jgi:hypothetical protein
LEHAAETGVKGGYLQVSCMSCIQETELTIAAPQVYGNARGRRNLYRQRHCTGHTRGSMGHATPECNRSTVVAPLPNPIPFKSISSNDARQLPEDEIASLDRKAKRWPFLLGGPSASPIVDDGAELGPPSLVVSVESDAIEFGWWDWRDVGLSRAVQIVQWTMMVSLLGGV